GCIPTKAFVKNAEVLREVKHAGEMGIEVESFKTNWSKVIERKNGVVSKLTGGVSGLLKRHKVEVIMGEAVINTEHEILVGDKSYDVDNIVIACGSDSVMIPIENDNSVKVYDSEGMLNIDKLPEDLVIIGGGVIGVELAGIMNEFGVHVTIVEMLDSILAMADDDVIQVVDKELRNHGIDIITGVGASKLAGGNVVLSDGREIKADAVLMSVGRKPVKVASNINILVSERGFVEIDNKLRTSVDNIYAIGDVTGKVMLAHTASRQGIVVAEDLYGEGATVDYSRIPSCVFTIPEVAWIGLNEKQAEELGIPYKSSKMPFAGVGKALAMNDTTGFVKVITDERFDEIIGVHIVGLNASDIVAQGAIAIDLEATSEEIANITFAHPTLSEGFMEACEGISGKMIHG
ncbi:dihydrolipoyl dehydrogenase, partial [Anaerofustis stercorihominis]